MLKTYNVINISKFDASERVGEYTPELETVGLDLSKAVSVSRGQIFYYPSRWAEQRKIDFPDTWFQSEVRCSYSDTKYTGVKLSDDNREYWFLETFDWVIDEIAGGDR